ncbi:MAG: hypothetical protein WCJ30_04235 [Deltaproteobacteria bacterium]
MLLDLDDLAPDQPVRLDHRRVDRARDVAARRLDDVNDASEARPDGSRSLASSPRRLSCGRLLHDAIGREDAVGGRRPRHARPCHDFANGLRRPVADARAPRIRRLQAQQGQRVVHLGGGLGVRRDVGFDPRADPGDPLAGIEPYPAPLDPAKIPVHLRGNPLVEAYLALTPEQEAGLSRLADSDAEDDEAVAAALAASVR